MADVIRWSSVLLVCSGVACARGGGASEATTVEAASNSPAADVTAVSATGEPGSYTFSVTTEEALLQFLASVYAMDTSGKDVIKTHKSLVFIVGTHIGHG